jgi:hypothetical protein
MKRSELKEVIRQAMLDEITVVDKDTKLQDLPDIDPKKATSAIQTAKATQEPVSIAEDRFMDAALEDLEQVVRNLARTAYISEEEAAEMAINHIQDMFSEEELDEEYEGADLGALGDNALGLEEAVKKADAVIADYRK